MPEVKRLGDPLMTIRSDGERIAVRCNLAHPLLWLVGRLDAAGNLVKVEELPHAAVEDWPVVPGAWARMVCDVDFLLDESERMLAQHAEDVAEIDRLQQRVQNVADTVRRLVRRLAVERALGRNAREKLRTYQDAAVVDPMPSMQRSHRRAVEVLDASGQR